MPDAVPQRELETRVEATTRLLVLSFERFLKRVKSIASGAREHFQRGDWHAIQRDSLRRLDLHGDLVEDTLWRLSEELGEEWDERELWRAVRTRFAAATGSLPEAELAETFFNSNVRRVLRIVGVDAEVEFLSPIEPQPPAARAWSHTLTVPCDGKVERAIRRLLPSLAFELPWYDFEGDVAMLTSRLQAALPAERVLAFEVGREPFYRGRSAYVVGEIRLSRADGAESQPFVLALANVGNKLAVDAALFTEDEASIVFSFARAPCLVAAERPVELVDWLATILPKKPRSDLWNAIGFHRHGKTRLYRSLLRQLATTEARFEVAPGKKGMVMAVFVLPGFDVVFKVIRDRFEYPKTVTHAEVREKYALVHRHDRAGRLVEAQHFEHLEFPVSRFEPTLLEELVTSTAETVRVHGDNVVIEELYTERRVEPLDLYLARVDFEEARRAVLDYGQAVKDLAASNVFPGDMLLKNFGVTRHGRLVFYDYDELCLLTDCRFRDLPKPRFDDEETAGEPWFFVDPHDVFPEEFERFLGLAPELLEVFVAAHGDLLDPAYWRGLQERIRRGEILDVYPYRNSRRLRASLP